MLLNFIWYLDGRFTVYEADVRDQAEAVYNACFELISQPFKESQWTVVAVGSIFSLPCVELTYNTLASNNTFAFCTLSCFRQYFKRFRFFIVILLAVLKLLFQVFKVHSLKTKDFAHLDFSYFSWGAAVGS